jgi:hypothetical protein
MPICGWGGVHPIGNAWSLFEQHSESGIHITPKTAQSLWLGEKMDDDLAVLGMLQLE